MKSADLSGDLYMIFSKYYSSNSEEISTRATVKPQFKLFVYFWQRNKRLSRPSSYYYRLLRHKGSMTHSHIQRQIYRVAQKS